MRKVGILYHPLKESSFTLAKELERFLTARDVSVWLCSAWEEEKARVNGTDLVITIGGDGTILRAAQIVLPASVPITGINQGRVGFMTELSADEALDKLPDLLAGKGWIDERAMLEVALITEKGKPPRLFHALNDVVLARGPVARMIHIEVTINNERLTTYRADGVIVATATGSTGYSLATGGPILYPQSHDFILAPIVPHLSPTYPLVLPSQATVVLGISPMNPATLSVDGHMNVSLPDGAEVTVRHSARTTRFLRIHAPDSYYSTLEQKLKGK